MALPLKVQNSAKAVPLAGDALNPGGKASVDHGGYLVLDFPFNAGVYKAHSCTNLELLDAYQKPSGGLFVSLQASQRWGCPRKFFTEFDYRRPTNPDTRYRLFSNGQAAIIKGTKGTIQPGRDGAIFAIEEGVIDVESSSGDRAQVFAGEMAIANNSGIIVQPIPRAEYSIQWRGSQAQIIFPLGVTAWVDGREIEPGDWLFNPNSIRIRGVLGEESTHRIYRWPYF